MLVVLDTNIWIKELALSTGIGAAFRFYMKRNSLRLAVPEVVQLEVQEHLRRTIADAIEDVGRGNRQLLALFGSMKEIILPKQVEIDLLVEGVFKGLGVEIVEISFSLESARASFLKTIMKLPPSDKTQEFKDGVLWADCLSLLEKDDVLLVSQDKAFYMNRDYEKGLAQNLRMELANKSMKLTLVNSLVDVLERLEISVDLDEDWLLSTFLAFHPSRQKLLERAGVEVNGPTKFRYELFATENSDRLYITYYIETPCIDVSDFDRIDIRLTLKGDAVLDLNEKLVSERKIIDESISFFDRDGGGGQIRNSYLNISSVLGHRTIGYSVRHKIRGE